MHVLFATYEFHPTTPGGAGVLIRHAVAHLLAAGHHVSLLIDTPAESFQRLCTIDHAALPNRDHFHPFLVADLVNAPPAWPIAREDVHNLFVWQSARFAAALERLLVRQRLRSDACPSIDLIEFFDFAGAGYHAAMMRRFAPTTAPHHDPHASLLPPVQIRVHGPLEVIDALDPTFTPDADRDLLYRLERGALALADRVVIPSNSFAEAMLREPYGLPDARTLQLPPPHDPNSASTNFAASASGEPLDDTANSSTAPSVTILFVGRIFGLKGVDQLVRVGIDLLTRRPDLNATIELVGGDSEFRTAEGRTIGFTAHLKSQIPTHLRPRFRFTGHIAQDQVRDAFRRATVVVFPNRVESFCYALHEAAAESAAIIARDIPAFRAFIDSAARASDASSSSHPSALLFRDDAELFDALQSTLDDPALRARLRTAARNAAFYGRLLSAPRLPAEAIVGPPLRDPSNDRFDATTIAPLAIIVGRQTSTNPFSNQTLQPSALTSLDSFDMVRAWAEAEARTQSASPAAAAPVAILNSSMRAAPAWLERCVLALRRDPTISFAGSWLTVSGRPLARLLDLDPDAEHSSLDPRLAAWSHRHNPAGPALVGCVVRDATTLAVILNEPLRIGRVRADQHASLQGLMLPELLLAEQA